MCVFGEFWVILVGIVRVFNGVFLVLIVPQSLIHIVGVFKGAFKWFCLGFKCFYYFFVNLEHF